MRHLRTLLLLATAVACSACFQFSTVLSVRTDGSGTIEQRVLFTKAAVAQLRQLMPGGGGAPADLFSEQQARDAAAGFGPGVAYVSSTAIDTSEGVGRDVTYAFSDVNSLRLDQMPSPPGGVPLSPGANERVSFSLKRQPTGNALLTIAVPRLPTGGASRLPATAAPEQLGLLRPMLAGARMSIDIEPAGQLVRTNSPFVTGRRVTLLDVRLDDLFADATLLQRLQAAGTPEDAKIILKDVPGLKVNLDPELTIEFR
jgi:hypothetical protein